MTFTHGPGRDFDEGMRMTRIRRRGQQSRKSGHSLQVWWAKLAPER